MILGLLKDYGTDKAADKVIADVRIGLCYTAVLLDDGHAGLAYTFRNHLAYGCDILQSKRPLAGRSAAELLQYLISADILERTIGIATANALINTEPTGLIEGDTLDILGLRDDDRVGMVGFFGPLIADLKKTVKELFIFEKITARGPGLYPEVKAFELLPACTVAIITATSLINESLGRLLDACCNCRMIALLGATTPLAPKVFKQIGVGLLSGVIITDQQALLQRVSEGGGMRSFKNAIKKVNLILNP